MTNAATVLSALNEMNDQYADGGTWKIKDTKNYRFDDEKGPIYYVTYTEGKGYEIEKTDDNRPGFISTSHDHGTPRAARYLLANARWNGSLKDVDLVKFETPRYLPKELGGES